MMEILSLLILIALFFASLASLHFLFLKDNVTMSMRQKLANIKIKLFENGKC